MALKVLDLELSEEIQPIRTIAGYNALYILVRYRAQPVGWITLTDLRQPAVSAERLREAVVSQLGRQFTHVALDQHLKGNPASNNCSLPISVVVCTRDRTSHLKVCLPALLALEYPDYEIVVVDNAPHNDDTARFVANLPVRYVREDRPGLNWARNRGIAESRHDIIAFTDDDARPDRRWLRAIVRAFAEQDVLTVTGPVVPAELETDAQVLFEFGYGGMSHGFHRRTIRRQLLTERDLLWASAFGVGANMAFRRELFASVGPFDVALDVGTPSRGGGDIEMFHRLVARGHALVYEPAALVWHLHRRDRASLRRQLHDNGRSFGTYLLTCARNRTVSRRAILSFTLREWLAGWVFRRLLRPSGFPRSLIAAELAGAFSSPLAYRASQAYARQTAGGQARSRATAHIVRYKA